MSDFLQHLVERSRSNASALRPRLPSRFEAPSTEENAVGTESASFEELQPAQPRPRERWEITVAEEPALEPANGPAESVGMREIVEPSYRHTMSVVDQPMPTERAKRRISPDPESGPADRVRPREISDGKDTSAIPPVTVSGSGDVGTHGLTGAADPSMPIHPAWAPNSVAEVVTPRVAERVLANDGQRRDFAHDLRDERQFATNAVRAMPPRAKTPAAMQGDAQQTVHVTIGRIEVRAAQRATARPQTQGHAKPTSLDDYLAQRNGRS